MGGHCAALLDQTFPGRAADAGVLCYGTRCYAVVAVCAAEAPWFSVDPPIDSHYFFVKLDASSMAAGESARSLCVLFR